MMRRHGRVLALSVLATALGTACGPAPNRQEVAGNDPGAVLDSLRRAALERQGARSAVGAVPTHFALGRAADSVRIADWNVDVRPDGAGLPPGSGTVADGALVYARTCAPCHGAQGEGGPNDRLVATSPQELGRAIGSYWPYATTVFDYTRRAMPWDRPGSMSDDEVWDVVAWLLHRNGLLAEDAGLDSATLVGIEMPALGRFVPDDREGSTTVR